MKTKPSITSTQLLFMAVGSALMFPYTFLPILNTAPGNQDVWIVMIISILYVLPISLPVLFLIKIFRGFSINDIIEITLGKFFGKIISFLFTTIFLFCFIACTSLAVIFISTSALPGTPIWATILLSFIVVSYASYKGVGTIGRLATFIVPFVIFTIFLFFLMGFSIMDFKVLQPILVDSTFLELNRGAFFTGSRFSEILMFLVFSFFLPQSESINKTYVKSMTVFFVLFAMILFPTILVLGIDIAKSEFDPYFQYTSQVNAYDFIERAQSLNTLGWFPGFLLKLTIYNFMACHILSGVFNTKSHKSFVIPISVLSFFICTIPMMQKSSVIMLLASDRVFPWIVLPFTFVLPLLILIVYLIRRKKINTVLKQKKADAALSDSSASQETEMGMVQ